MVEYRVHKIVLGAPRDLGEPPYMVAAASRCWEMPGKRVRLCSPPAVLGGSEDTKGTVTQSHSSRFVTNWNAFQGFP